MKDKHNPDSLPQSNSFANGEPVNGSPSASHEPRARNTNPRRRKPAPPRTLIETKGPEPATPLVDVRLSVGRLGGPHGVRGEIKMRLLTDDPDHLKTVKRVYLGERDTPVPLENVRFTNEGALVKLGGTDTPEDASRLSGLSVKISGADARPLEEGEYFLFQLIGLKAEDENGEPMGTVVDMIETGASDVLVIAERPGMTDQLLVPNHPEFVLEISPDQNRIVIRPPVYEG